MKKLFDAAPYAFLALIATGALLLMNAAIRSAPAEEQEASVVSAGYELLTLSPTALHTAPPLPALLLAVPKLAFAGDALAPRWVSVIAALALIALIFFVAASVLGKFWALLPAFLAAYAPVFLGYGSRADGAMIAALAAFLSLTAMTAYFLRPSQRLLIFSGLAFGAALAATFAAIILPLLYFTLFGILYAASIAFDWEGADPATRGYRFRVRAWRYAYNFFLLVLLGGAVLYAFYALTVFPFSLDAQVAATQVQTPSVFINWLSGNVALRPLGAYALGLAQYFPVNRMNTAIFSSLAFYEPIPLLLLIALGLCSGLFRIIAGVVASLRSRLPLLLNYIGTRPREFAFQLFAALGAIAALGSAADGPALKLLLFAPLLILVSQPVKRWFFIFDGDLARNLVLRVLIFANSFVSLSLKTLVLIAGLIWYFATTIAASPEFLGYANMFG